VLVDTPGLRAVTLWVADDGFRRAFADIEARATECRFHDCAHDQEPGCAVQAAVAAGEIDAARVAHYRELDAELDRVAIRDADRERSRRAGRRPRPAG
jgi:ribosome biogenesis GTPase